MNGRTRLFTFAFFSIYFPNCDTACLAKRIEKNITLCLLHTCNNRKSHTKHLEPCLCYFECLKIQQWINQYRWSDLDQSPEKYTQ